MEQQAIAALQIGERFEGYLLVRTAEARVGSSGKKYVDMTLTDRTGEVNAKVWDGNAPVPEAGSILKIRAEVRDYNGRVQLKVEKYEILAYTDTAPMSLLVPCAPIPADKMLTELKEAAAKLKPAGLRRLVERLLDVHEAELLYYPAASKLHHAERAGLLHHTTSMLHMAYHYADEYPQLDRSLLIAGVITHDMSKITEFDVENNGLAREYTADGMLIGHLVRGVSEIDRIGREEQCPEETLMLLEHMILSHHGVPEYGSPKPGMIPEAEVLHHLDVVDARIFEMTAALERVRPGAFTEKLWSLDRKLYRRSIPAPSKDEEGSNE